MLQRGLIVADIEERQKILTSLDRAHALTGADVAQNLKRSRNRDDRVIIHSMNPKGAEQILSILPDAIYYLVSKIVRSNRAFNRLRTQIDQGGASCDCT